MGADSTIAPRIWRGRFFEDFTVRDLYRSRFGRTVAESDNLLVTCLTMNTNPVHFEAPFAESTRFGQILVNSTLTLAVVTGLTVSGTSENAAANLEWTDIKLPAPVFIGDTLWAESEIIETRESRSNPDVGIVRMRTRGVNQRGEVVIEFRRAFMVYRRGAPQASDRFPVATTDWSV